MKVLIFGVGPSGLAAAAAAKAAGVDQILLLSKRIEKSHLYGCQYLHAPIPVYTSRSFVYVESKLIGKPQDYKLKVYGNQWNGMVSPEEFSAPHQAWDIRLTYDNLWKDFNEEDGANFRRVDVSPDWLLANYNFLDSFDHVWSTIPAPALCSAGHLFRSRTIWATGDTDPMPEEAEVYPPDNTVVCDGTDEHSWYRSARVFGYRTIEWAEKPFGVHRTVGTQAAEVRKPISTNCNCFPGIVRMGRYGLWKKGVLVHHVYQQADYILRLAGAFRPETTPHSDICPSCGQWGERYLQTSAMYCYQGHTWTSRMHRPPPIV